MNETNSFLSLTLNDTRCEQKMHIAICSFDTL